MKKLRCYRMLSPTASDAIKKTSAVWNLVLKLHRIAPELIWAFQTPLQSFAVGKKSIRCDISMCVHVYVYVCMCMCMCVCVCVCVSI